MDKIKRILVPLDGTALAEKALPYAIQLANQYGATLVLKRVMQTNGLLTGSPITGSSPAQAPLEVIQEGEIYLKYTGKCLTNPDHIFNLPADRVETILAYGRPIETITEALKLEKINLIVMTTHGRSGLSDLILGSTAAGILEHSAVPVMLIRANTRHQHEEKESDLEDLLDQPKNSSLDQPVDQRRIVVALDGQHYAEKALDAAAELATAFQANVHLLEVVRPPAAIAYGLGYMEEVEEVRREANSGLNQAAYSYLLKIQNRLQSQGLRSVKIVRSGDPATEIASYAETVHAMCLVMATHAPPRAKRAFLGSTAQDVLHRTYLPVVMVHPTDYEAGSSTKETVSNAVQPQ